MIKFRNYQIERFDDNNFMLEKIETTTALRDVKNSAGGFVTMKGDEYQRVVRIGYFRNLELVLRRIVDDTIGVDCDSLADIANQISALKEDLAVFNAVLPRDSTIIENACQGLR